MSRTGLRRSPAAVRIRVSPLSILHSSPGTRYLTPRFPPVRAPAALTLLHVPYLFAGKSSVGLDCSGLVGTTSDAYGCVLPRDAAQQFVSGSLVATRWYREGLRPGDRIYFLNGTGKIFHTGLSLGGRHVVHSSPPGVQINSLQEGDRLYRESWDRQFLGARRP